MKMKFLLLSTLAAALLSGCLTGCMTSKTTTVTPGGTNSVTGAGYLPVTNTVVTVNQANLTLDCGVLQGITAGAVSVVVAKEPGSIPALKDAAVALDGILNGANTNTTAQVIGLLGGNANPVLNTEVTSLLSTVSALEQQLLAKYGPMVGGQIALAITRAVSEGLVTGLAGQ